MAAIKNERELKRKLEQRLGEIAQRFKSGHVSVGWPESSKYPADGEKNPEYIAAVAFKNEFGDPINHQPPRPFFRRMIAIEKPLMHRKVGALLKKFSVDQTLGMMGADIALQPRANNLRRRHHN